MTPTHNKAVEARARELLAAELEADPVWLARQRGISVSIEAATAAIKAALSTPPTDPVPAVAGGVIQADRDAANALARLWVERGHIGEFTMAQAFAAHRKAALARAGRDYQQPALDAGGDADPLHEHVEAMQGMCERYLIPEPYVARNGMMAKADDHVTRDKLFIADMIYMLDGPEQREAQFVRHHAPDAGRDLGLRAAMIGCNGVSSGPDGSGTMRVVAQGFPPGDELALCFLLSNALSPDQASESGKGSSC